MAGRRPAATAARRRGAGCGRGSPHAAAGRLRPRRHGRRVGLRGEPAAVFGRREGCLRGLVGRVCRAAAPSRGYAGARVSPTTCVRVGSTAGCVVGAIWSVGCRGCCLSGVRRGGGSHLGVEPAGLNTRARSQRLRITPSKCIGAWGRGDEVALAPPGSIDAPERRQPHWHGRVVGRGDRQSQRMWAWQGTFYRIKWVKKRL